MKVILDANILISYLLTAQEAGTIVSVVERCFSDDIRIVLPNELVDEIVAARAEKPYLHARIPLQRLDHLLQSLQSVAEIPEPVDEIASYVSDANDDYLIAYGLVQNVDHLITGDAELLALRKVGTLKIVDPVEFLDILAGRKGIG